MRFGSSTTWTISWLPAGCLLLLILYSSLAHANERYFIKPVNRENPVYIVVPLPINDSLENGKNPFRLSIRNVEPVVAMAIDHAYDMGYVDHGSLKVKYRDSMLSDAHGPNVAIQQLVKNKLDCIIGYAFVYALAPVARMSPTWQDDDSTGIPIITPIGLTMNLDNKSEYQLMTRISSPYKNVVAAVAGLFELMEWRRHVFLFHHVKEPTTPVGECYLLMGSIQSKMKKIIEMEHNFYMFNEHNNINRTIYKQYLMQSSFIGNAKCCVY